MKPFFSGLFRDRRRLFTALLGGAVVLLVVVFSVLTLGGVCPFYGLFGIPCGGCGMTRAALCLLHLDFAGAFSYHAGVFLLPLLVLCLFFLRKRWAKILLVGIACFFGAYYIFRMVTLFPHTEPFIFRSDAPLAPLFSFFSVFPF